MPAKSRNCLLSFSTHSEILSRRGTVIDQQIAGSSEIRLCTCGLHLVATKAGDSSSNKQLCFEPEDAPVQNS